MSCCGQKRAAAASATHGRQHAPLAAPASAGNGPDAHLVRYLGTSPLSLRGPRSGQVYYFAEAGKTARVDERDIDALLRTRLFVRAPA